MKVILIIVIFAQLQASEDLIMREVPEVFRGVVNFEYVLGPVHRLPVIKNVNQFTRLGAQVSITILANGVISNGEFHPAFEIIMNTDINAVSLDLKATNEIITVMNTNAKMEERRLVVIQNKLPNNVYTVLLGPSRIQEQP